MAGDIRPDNVSPTRGDARNRAVILPTVAQDQLFQDGSRRCGVAPIRSSCAKHRLISIADRRQPLLGSSTSPICTTGTASVGTSASQRCASKLHRRGGIYCGRCRSITGNGRLGVCHICDSFGESMLDLSWSVAPMACPGAIAVALPLDMGLEPWVAPVVLVFVSKTCVASVAG